MTPDAWWFWESGGFCGDCYYLREWFRKTTEKTEDTEKTATLCALRVLCG